MKEIIKTTPTIISFEHNLYFTRNYTFQLPINRHQAVYKEVQR